MFHHSLFKVGEIQSVSGFISWHRGQGKISFVGIQSGGETVQCVVLCPELIARLHGVLPGSWIEVGGRIKADPRSKTRGVELEILSIQEIAPTRPVDLSEESAEHLWLEYPALRARRPRIAAALETKSALLSGARRWLESEGFMEIQSPKMMGSPSESGAEVFKVDYFGETAYLAQSPQFYKQLAILGGLGKVWEVGPVFRAEKSTTPRHATEFCGLDLELEGVRTAEELISIEVALLESATLYALESLRQRYPGVQRLELPMKGCEVLRWKEALHLAGETQELTTAGERRLGEVMAAKGVEMVAVVEMPWAMRPFYHQRQPSGASESFELLYKGVEITTGAIREHRPEVLHRQLEEKGLTGAGAEWYLEAFHYGAPPHGGFGLGVERWTALWLGRSGIRECQMVPRFPGRMTP